MSKPRYRPLRIDGTGVRHLLLTDKTAVPADIFAERWAIAGCSSAPGERQFASLQHLLLALRDRLAAETMGLRLYAIGREPFVWAIHNAAAEYGIGPDEIRLFAMGSAARRVFCNHCRTITEAVTTTIVTCSGCHAHLLVRDHFSRRLNAYAGVQVDAEVPGAIPAIVELDR